MQIEGSRRWKSALLHHVTLRRLLFVLFLARSEKQAEIRLAPRVVGIAWERRAIFQLQTHVNRRLINSVRIN